MTNCVNRTRPVGFVYERTKVIKFVFDTIHAMKSRCTDYDHKERGKKRIIIE